MKRILLLAYVLTAACKAGGPAEERNQGQDDFISAPPNGTSRGLTANATADGAAPGAAAPEASAAGDTSTATRTVQETDLYAIDGDRLYYLNGYRGFMVFDISTIDQPKLLARSPIFGDPIQMIVTGGIASVVISDWYGKLDNGEPFRGSIVRTIDARDPTALRVLGEARLGGYVRDTRVVGDVLYAVSEDNGWSYGWGGVGIASDVAVSAPGGGAPQASITISSVNLKTTQQAGSIRLDGYSGVFNVTSHAILLARTLASDGIIMPKTELQYVDISDPAGAIALKGKIQVNGSIQGWSSDNGRFNLDFSDEHYARIVTCGQAYCGGTNGSYLIHTVDFSNHDTPVAMPSLSVPSTGWSIAARFSGTRLYVAPSDGYYDLSAGTPVKIYDLTNPNTPVLAGETGVSGNVWMFVPNGDHLFALGSDIDGVDYGSKVALHYLDVTDPTHPTTVGTSTFGSGWAWTPAAGTFKAFTLDTAQALVALPFSGWSWQSNGYNNGVQLIEFTNASITTRGAAKTKGWVSRGIFAKSRLLSLSDTALSVVNYDDRTNPIVVKELTLARNVIDAVPNGDTITHLSTDWWDNDVSASTLRVLPMANADEVKSLDATQELAVDGTQARLFRNGQLAYVLTNVRKPRDCGATGGGGGIAVPSGGTVKPTCYSWTQKITVVDLSNGGAVTRGAVELPVIDNNYWYWGFYGCFFYDWYNGGDAVQVANDTIAIRRWLPAYNQAGYVESTQALYVVDLRNPNAPALASTQINADPKAWWGNMFTSGNSLYTTSYEWLTMRTLFNNVEQTYVRYYLNRIDLSDPANPKVGAKINVPGVVVGISEADPTIAYSIDYRWNGDSAHNWFMTLKLTGNRAVLQGFTEVSGYTGRVFPRGDKVYFSAQTYDQTSSHVQLHELDIANPRAPVDRVSTDQTGWGWLLGLAGDRAVVITGWGSQGVDLYKLAPGSAPSYDQTVRTRGWWPSALSRQDNKLFLSSGYWGVQVISVD